MPVVQTVKELADEMTRELRRGYAFVPLVGAGLSEPSGIPTIRELKVYLAKCIFLALKHSWDPRVDSWPSLRETSDKSDESWSQKIIEHFNALHHGNGAGSNGQVSLYQEAVGALADWRTMLLFLSRWEFKGQRPRSAAPDGRIIDAFFLHVVANQQPSLGHRMLASLSEVLRFRIVLTTNFDSLLEQVFDQAGNPLTLFDVHLNAGMPAASNVLARYSIIKLHGGRYGLRGDFSLDSPPKYEDRLNFVSYLAGQELADSFAKDGFENSSHLLVAGISGNDPRITSLIDFAISVLPHLRVFWICYSQESFDELKRRTIDIGGHHAQAFYLLRHTNLGLLFLELHQRIAHCIPPTGLEFPAIWQLATPAETPPSRIEGTREYFAECKDEISKELDKALGSRGKILVVESAKGVRGVSSLCSAIFNEQLTHAKCLWLDLDDFYGFEDFGIRLRAAVARIAGHNELKPNLLPNNPDGIRRKLEELIGGSKQKWILFFNARDEPGSNAGFNSQRTHVWTARHKAAFWELLQMLAAGPNPLCSVVILRYKENFRNAQDSRAADRTYRLERSCVDFSNEKVISATDIWLQRLLKDEPDTAAIRFAYALTLFRQARYPASLITWAVIWLNNVSDDHDECRSKKAEEWLGKLAEQGIIQFKTGGFVWMHTEIRQSLKKILETKFRQRAFKAEVHQSIADWYYKLYLSSGDPLAVFESIYHRGECARAALHAPRGGRPVPSVRALQESAMREAVNLLRLARNSILSTGNPESNKVSLEGLRQGLESQRLPLADELADLYENIIFDITREAADFPTCFGLSKQRQFPDKAPASAPKSIDLVLLEQELEQAILFTGMRSYDRADTTFVAIAKKLKLPVSPWTGIPVVRLRAQNWAYKYRRFERVLRFGVRFLRRWMFLKMLQSQAMHLLARERENMDESRSLLLVEAKHCYHFSLEIMRFIPERGDGFIQHDNSVLRSHLAITLASMDRFTEGFRRIFESLSFLINSPRRDEGMSRAVVELRLAEIYIQKAIKLPLFHRHRNSILKRREIVALTEDRWTNEVRQVKALLRDSAAALNRAEKQLRSFHKNVWWWTLFYLLTIKVWELWYTVEARPGGSMISIDGLDNPPVPELKIPPVLILREVMSMVRLDAFSLARILESYTAILKICDVCKSGRFGDMEMSAPIDCLDRSISGLSGSLRKRDSAELNRLPLDERLRRYVGFVLSDSRKCLARLRKLTKEGKRKLRATKTPHGMLNDLVHQRAPYEVSHYS